MSTSDETGRNDEQAPDSRGKRAERTGHRDSEPDYAAARRAIEGHTARSDASDEADANPADDLPPAGSHAEPRLINEASTPGAGTLTPPGGHDDIDSTSS